MKRLQNLYRSIAENSLRAAILISSVCLITFGNTLLNDYNLDDNLVTQNHRLTSKGIKVIPEIYRSPYYEDDMGYSYGYRPTTLASFAIEHEIFGESARVSHTINLILYLITCVLMYLLIKRIFPDKAGIALGAALLFTVHPIHTEVVASIKNRDEILSLLFAMLACFFLIRPKRFFLSLISGSALFFLSLSSKMSGVNFIFLLAIVPAYPKPFLKDIALLSLYAVSLYLIFEGRDVMYDDRFLDIIIISGSFLLLTTITSKDIDPIISRLRNVQRELVNKIESILSRFVRSVLIGKRDYKSTNAFEITCVTAITFLLLNSKPYPDKAQFAFLAFVVVLQLIISANRSSMLLLFSSVLLGSDLAFWYHILLLISVINNLIDRDSHFLSKSIVYTLVGLGFSFLNNGFEINYLSLNLTISISAFALTHEKLARHKRYSLISAIVLSSISIRQIVINPPTEPLVLYKSLAYIILLIIMSTVAKLRVIKSPELLRFKTFISSWYKTIITRKFVHFLSLILLVMLLTISLFGSHSYLNPNQFDFRKQEALYGDIKAFVIHNLNLDADEYLPNQPWTSTHMQSWTRPFNYVEHPLSPAAPIWWKIGTASETIGRYTQQLFLPYPLAYYYGFNEVRISHLWSWRPIGIILFHLGLLILGFSQLRNYPPLSIGILLYLLSIGLFSGLVEMVPGMFSDRFSYVASFGFCLAIAGAIEVLLNSSKKDGIRVVVTGTAFLVMISFSSYSITRNSQWKKKLTLMKHDIEHVPNSAQAHNLLAHAIMEDVFADNSVSGSEIQNVQNAVRHFARATEIYPLFFNAWVDLAKVHEILGNPEESINAREKALSIDSTYSPIIIQLAQSFERLGQTEKAIELYYQYLKLEPQNAQVYDRLAKILFQLGRYNEAEAVCVAYLKIDPRNETFNKNLATIQSLLHSSENEVK